MKQSSSKEKDLVYEITENNVIPEVLACISSEKVRDYMLLHKQEYSILQFATLVEEYINKSRRSKFFKALKEKTEDLYEKELLQIATNDYEKEGYISDKTNEFYLKNDPRKENKPSYPFCEIVPLPILFKEGDVVTSFLGSYNTTVKINPGNKDGEYILEFQANNISSWESATRLRKDNDGDGRHDGIIPSKERGTGIRLGGNFSQTWKWSETINVQ